MSPRCVARNSSSLGNPGSPCERTRMHRAWRPAPGRLHFLRVTVGSVNGSAHAMAHRRSGRLQPTTNQLFNVRALRTCESRSCLRAGCPSFRCSSCSPSRLRSRTRKPRPTAPSSAPTSRATRTPCSRSCRTPRCRTSRRARSPSTAARPAIRASARRSSAVASRLAGRFRSISKALSHTAATIRPSSRPTAISNARCRRNGTPRARPSALAGISRSPMSCACDRSSTA
ncbi:hypothetical protein AWB80_07833 [Caballeronia pedi]|uniref:Uncharacterized protein n=1 Tax=Caballeronia pedi TaxID=1777141 RepID=A0A158E035_9BURK|nr:hypothetical protein AWB80_07833 [Caballeronia pedi]